MARTALFIMVAVVIGLVASTSGFKTYRAEADTGIALQEATATCSTVDDPVSEAIPAVRVFGEGWRCGTNIESTAVFETQTDVGLGLLTFKFEENWSTTSNCGILGRVRLSATNAARTEFANGLANGGDVDTTWTVLDPINLINGAQTLTELGDHSVLGGGQCNTQPLYLHTFSVQALAPFTGITGFRLEALKDASLDDLYGGGPGMDGFCECAPLGTFFLNAFSVTTTPLVDLTITKTHTGDFVQGSTGNTYTVTVSNTGVDKDAGELVSVTDAPPTGLTVTAMSGNGWTCTSLPTCTRSDALAVSASYPAITVTVSVAADATSPLVNSVSVSTTQTEGDTANNTATDSTVITVPTPDLTITKTHTGDFVQGSADNTYTVTVTNSGVGDKLAGQAVSVTDAPPTGLTVTAMSGNGWTCTSLPTCTRSDALAVSASYPAITVTVSVAIDATSPRVNSITVTTAQAESNGGNNTATDSTTITAPVPPDLTITKTHTGNFVQGSTGNTYTVTVANSGVGDKLAGQAVTVTDAPPAGLTVTAMSGIGWTCTILPSCTRSDVLAPAASYPAITVTVSVAADATSPRVNSISVSTAQTESNDGNNTATDSTTITQPDLTITKTHTGNFVQGSTGNTYTVTVTNSGVGDKLAGQAVSVTDAPPTGLTVTAMSGIGWTCTSVPTCTRNDVLAPAASYPVITVTVTVAADATSPRVNSISVSTAQNESNGGNNTATDSTTITQPDLTITKTHSGNFVQGSTGNTYTVTVTNSGAGDKLAGQSVTVTDAPPTGLTVTAMSGTGWTCTVLPTCTRSDVLAPAASYPAITVTVSVAADATSPRVNSISVSTAQTENNSGNNTATDSTTITTPPPTGKLEIKKVLSPASDPGRFDLQIDSATAGTGNNVGNNGTTGEQTVNAGNRTVGEVAHSGTTLTNYTTAIVCKDNNGTGTTVASSADAGPLTVNVPGGSDIVCVITNTRKAFGKLEVRKQFVGAGIANVELKIDGTTITTVGASGGTTGEQSVLTGSRTVSESATGLSAYGTAITCKSFNGFGPTLASGPGASLAVNVTTNSDVVCVITNILIPPQCSSMAPFASVIAGTEGFDNLTGTNGNDLIAALGGALDSVNGLGGDDCILGGNGSDNIQGGAGNDFIDGGSGFDTINGGADTDICIGENKSACES